MGRASINEVGERMHEARFCWVQALPQEDDIFVEKISCLAEMLPIGNRIQLENGKVVFKPSNAEISCRDK